MGLRISRRIFWPLFLCAALGGGFFFWQRQPPQQVKIQLNRLEHSNAKVASRAWRKLNNLYYTDWAAFYLLLDQMQNDKPISFLVEKHSGETNAGVKKDFFGVNDRAIFYKADRVYCRTIGEALMAIAHNDPKLNSPFHGDWQGWWRQNQAAIQSGER